jgi:hypothetical protein
MGRARNIRRAVDRNLTDAKDSGHFEVGGYLYGLDASDIADDMKLHCEDAEDLTRDILEPYVQIWLEKNIT